MRKTIRLQHREYAGYNKVTKYRQYRINIPERIIKKVGWGKEDELTMSIESRKGKKMISLKIKD